MVSKYNITALIFISLFFLISNIFIFNILDQSYKFPDSYSYILACKQLYLEFKLNDHRPLLFSLINGFPLIFSNKIEYIFKWNLFLNIIFWFGTINIIFNSLKLFTSLKNAYYGTLFFSFSIGNLFIIFHLLTETLYTFFITLIVYYLLNFEFFKNKKHIQIALSLIILSCLIKPVSIGILLIFTFLYWKHFNLILNSKYLIFIFISIFLISIQLIGMKTTYGNYTLSYIDSATYYNYLGTKADCYKNNIEFIQGKNERVKKSKTLSLIEMKKLAKEDFEFQLINNYKNLIKAYFSNLYINSSKGSASVHGCKNLSNNSYFRFFNILFKAISKIQNIIFTIIGIILSTYSIIKFNKINKSILFSSFILLFIIGISAISTDQGDRFHLVLFPIVIILFINHIKILKQSSYTP